MRRATGELVCDNCLAPATYLRRDVDRAATADGEAACLRCARQTGMEVNGEAFAALETLGFAVQLAHNAGVTSDEVRAAVEAILTGEAGSEGYYPSCVDHVIRRGGVTAASGWNRIYTPISEAVA